MVVDSPEVRVDGPTRAPLRTRLTALAAVAAMLVGGLGAYSWLALGPRLVIERGDTWGIGVNPVGVPMHFRIALATTGGGAVELQSVTARHSANVEVHFSVLSLQPSTSNSQRLFWAGSAGPAGHARVVSGTRLAQRGDDAYDTTIELTVVPTRAGRWYATHFSVGYRSGWRRLHAVGDVRVEGTAS